MKNFIHKGKVLQMVAPVGGVTAGVAVLIGAILVVPATTAAAGESFAAYHGGVFELPKKSGDTFAQGAACHWNVANGYFTSTAASNYTAGIAEVAAGGTDTTVRVKIMAAVLAANA